MSLTNYFFETIVKKNLISKLIDGKENPFDVFEHNVKIKETYLFYGYDEYIGHYGYILFKNNDYIFFILSKKYIDNSEYLYTLNAETYSNIKDFDLNKIINFNDIEFTLKKYRFRQRFFKEKQKDKISFEKIISHSLVNSTTINNSVSQIIGRKIIYFYEGINNKDSIEKIALTDGKKLFKKLIKGNTYHIQMFKYGKNAVLSFVLIKVNKDLISYDIDFDKYFEFLIKNLVDIIEVNKEKENNLNYRYFINQLLDAISSLKKDNL